MKEYNFAEIEKKWQRKWQEMQLFKAKIEDKSRPKFYLLNMFPYPSGTLHIGHGRNYILGDVLYKFLMMNNYNVFCPMGWDAFGLPAENAAINTGIHPKDFTQSNIRAMKEQFSDWGIVYDWDYEISSCEPEYYKWTQWLFLKLFDAGLAYKKKGPVNWCPGCSTVLANEQIINNECERCGCRIEIRELEQWYFKITKYADRLLEDLELLEGWPERVKIMQENWIGKSYGIEIDFELEHSSQKLTVFTTRPDTIFGVTFLALAPEHPMAKELLHNHPDEEKLLKKLEEFKLDDRLLRGSIEYEKKGFYTGRNAINPVTGELIPIWVVNYVLTEYGTGAVMGVPAHDKRDFLFAKKFNLPVKIVVKPAGKTTLKAEELQDAFTEEGIQVNSFEFSGLPTSFAKKKISEYIISKGYGRKTVNYHLKDWLISRQRYWGAPIPIIYCDKCGIVKVPENELPVLLPHTVNVKPTGQSPLSDLPEFVNTNCPQCNGPARRETDTMDTFVDSSWYFLRFLTPHNDREPFKRELANYWLPVDQYIGGVEHAILHLLYSRFITKFLYDAELIDFDEPFKNLFTQGMICKTSYRCSGCNKYLPSDEVDEVTKKCKKCGTTVTESIDKMSKSKLNVVSPKELKEKYGVDTQRLYILFMGPPEKDAIWQDEGVVGCYRFLTRLWNFCTTIIPFVKNMKVETEELDSMELRRDLKEFRLKLHDTIKKITESFTSDLKFNTCVSAIMELLNTAEKTFPISDKEFQVDDIGKKVLKEFLDKVILIIAPFVPHIAEELNFQAGNSRSVFESRWPKYSQKALQQEEAEIAVQFDGKFRGTIKVSIPTTKEKLVEYIKSDKKLSRYCTNINPEKTVYVENKLINIITK